MYKPCLGVVLGRETATENEEELGAELNKNTPTDVAPLEALAATHYTHAHTYIHELAHANMPIETT